MKNINKGNKKFPIFREIISKSFNSKFELKYTVIGGPKISQQVNIKVASTTIIIIIFVVLE